MALSESSNTVVAPLEVESSQAPSLSSGSLSRAFTRSSKTPTTSEPSGSVALIPNDQQVEQPVVLSPVEEIRAVGQLYFENKHDPKLQEVVSAFGGNIGYRCGGRCFAGPKQNWKLAYFARSCLLVPTTYYFVEVAPILWQSHCWHPISFALLFGNTILWMLLTSLTDPGIIPRHALRLLVPELDGKTAKAIGLDPSHINPYSNECPILVLDVIANHGYRWCQFCRMIQPPRAKHCKDCDSCVLRCDHHCPFLKNCVGQRNYAFFYGFLVSVSVQGIVGCIGFVLSVKTIHRSVARTVIFYVVSIPTAILLLLVFTLTIFHTILSITGKTTKELLTGKVLGKGATLCAARGPRLLRAHDDVKFSKFVQA